MNIAVACICDAANVSRGNKLNVMGVFDSIGSAKFPARHPKMSIAFRFYFEPADAGSAYDIAVVLVDEDHRVVWPGVTGRFEAPDVSVEKLFVHANHVVDVADVVFPDAGFFRFDVQVKASDSGELVARHQIPFRTVFAPGRS